MYEIFAYQNAEALTGIFNMIAAIVGSSDYLGAVALVAFFGFVVAFIAYAFQPERLHGWKWLGTVVVVYSILFVPRVSVQITDRTGSSAPSIVDNVPLGVAVFGSMTSQVGNLLTQLFETAAQVLPGPAALPAELSYQQNGLMFGSRLIKYTRNLGFTNPTFRTDLIAFIDNCTKYDLMDGTIDPVAFSSSANVWGMMSTPNPARLTPITTGPGLSNIMPCTDAYGVLDAIAGTEVASLQARLGQQLNPTLAAAAASAAIGNQITVAYQRNRLADAATTAGQIVLQNAMINALNDASSIIGQKSNDPASLLLAMGRAQAVAQTNAAWINYGKVAEEALPLIRNVVEAICYTLFPVVILLLFMTSGVQTMMALKSYVVTLLWIQLWPPVYAVLNYMASIASAAKIGASADIGGGATALAMQTASSVYSNTVSLEAVVGYMVISIPAIAWAAIKGMETIGQAAITGTSSMQGTISAASSQAALGNVGMGNVSMEQQALGPSRTSPFWRSMQDDRSGSTWTTGAFGVRAVSMLRNSGFVSGRSGASSSASVEARASREIQSARDESVAASEERAALFAEALSHGRSRVDSTRLGSGVTTAKVGDYSTTLNEARGVVQSVARQLKVDDSVAAALLFNGGAGISGRADGSARRGVSGGGSRGGGAIDSSSVSEGGGVGINANLSAALQQRYGSAVGRETSRSDVVLSPEQVAAVKAFAERYTSDDNFVRAIATDGRDAEERSARNQRSVARTSRASASLSEAERFAQEVRMGSSRQDGMDFDFLQDPRNTDMLLGVMSRWDGSPRMAAAMAYSEIAQRDSLSRPTYYADGTVAHWGDESVRGGYRTTSTDSRYNPNVRGEFQSMRQEAGFRGVGRPVGPGDLQTTVDTRQAEARSSANRRWNQLEVERVSAGARAERDINATDQPGTNHNPRGTLGTRNVLANDAAGMFAQDAKESVNRVVDSFKEGAKEILK